MRVVLAGGDGLLLELLSDALRGQGVQVMATARSENEALGVLSEHRPDLAVLGIRMAPTHTDEGIRIAEALRRDHPEIGVLVFSSLDEPRYAERLLHMQSRPRAFGYLLKHRVGRLDRLVDAMRRIVAGEVIIDPQLVARLTHRPSPADPLHRLTPHERRILSLVAEGRSNQGIAAALACRTATVEKHLSTITDRLGLPSLADPVRPQTNVRVLAALTYLRATTQLSRRSG